MAYDEATLQHAINDVINNSMSKHKAAKFHGVPCSTLYNRLHGCLPRSEAHEQQPKLSKAFEDILVQWILKRERIGQAPNHHLTHNFATKLLEAEGVSPNKAKVDTKWIQRLYTRHLEIYTKRGTKLSSDRARGANSQTIEEFYKSLKELVTAKKITPQYLYNMDESGIANGLGAGGKVIGSSRTSRTYVEQHGDRTWTSSIHAICATGTATTPFIIFKGKTMQAQWFPREFPN